MCQGIRDAANLSWKLGAVLKGRAGDALLDSYGVERQAHVTALTTRIKAVGELVGERDAGKARERDARLLAECDGVVKSVPRQDVQPPLAAGVLSPAREPGGGTIFPQPWLIRESQAVLMDGVAGTGWRLVIDASASELQPASASPASDGLALRMLRVGRAVGALPERDGVLAGWFKRHRCMAALVRPDHYVYGTAQNLDDIAPLLVSAASAGSYRLAAEPTITFTS